MKIIHSADIHLGSKIEAKLPKDKADIRKSEVRQAFNKMVSYAALHEIKIIMISGDLFDSGVPLKKDKDYFYSVVRNNPDIDFIYLRGNHDSSECYSENIPENLKTFSEEWTTYIYGNVSISGIELTENNYKNAGLRLDLPADTINIVFDVAKNTFSKAVTDRNWWCNRLSWHCKPVSGSFGEVPEPFGLSVYRSDWGNASILIQRGRGTGKKQKILCGTGNCHGSGICTAYWIKGAPCGNHPELWLVYFLRCLPGSECYCAGYELFYYINAVRAVRAVCGRYR